MTREYVTVSDLHLFCARSVGEARMAEAEAELGNAAGLVLNGDIFDFRWSTLPSTEATAEAAAAWLGALAERHTDREIHYIFGNHDNNRALLALLEELEPRTPNLTVHPHHLRLGDTLFLHGDAATRRMTSEDLEVYRARWLDEERKGAAVNRIYEVGFRLGVHKAVHRLVSPEHRACARLAWHIAQLDPSVTQGLRNVYFGHTHAAIAGFEYGGLRFFNCGAALRGLPFQPLRVTINE